MAEDYGIASVANSLGKQAELTRKRHEEELAQKARENQANVEKTRIAETSAKITQDLVGELGGLTSTLDRVQKGAAEVEALKSDGGLMSTLDLIGKQVRDPGTYTRAGRAKAIAEATQIMGARAQEAGIRQSALNDLSQVVDAKLKESGSGLESAALNERQNQELIQTELLRVQTMTQTLASNQQLAESRLAVMTEEETKAAFQKAGGKPIDIGGVMIDPGTLEKRVQAIDERAYARETRAAALQAKNDELAKKAAQRELESMNIEELRPMVLNGDPRFELDDIKKTYETKKAAQADELSRLGLQLQYEDFGAATIAPAIQDAERISRSIPKNSPMEGALQEYRTTIGTILGTQKQLEAAGQTLPVEARAAGAKAIQESKERLDKAIDKEATLRSKGDKNLKDAYTDLYRGEPVQPASIEAAITTRLQKGAPLDDVLPAETAQVVRNRYNDLVQKFQKENIMGTMDRDTIRKLATQQAIREGIGLTITERTQDMFTRQLKDPSNPLYGAVNQQTMLGMVAQSDAEGVQDFKRTYNLTDEEYTRFSQGETIEGKVGPQHQVELGAIQGQRFLMQLDAVNPGLAKRYVDWWTTQGPGFAEKLQADRVNVARQTNLQSAAMEAFAGDMEKEGQYAYMQTLNQALESYEGAKEERFNQMVSFDYKPEHRQAALLQMDDSLNDDERQTFMKEFIFPIMRQAKEQNLPYEKTNELIEAAIDSNMTQDPKISKLLGKVSKNRVKIRDNVESIMQKPFWRAQNPNLRRAYNRKYEWYENIAGDM